MTENLGRVPRIYELCADGIRVGISDFGAAINYIRIQTERGWRDVCLGFDDADEYILSGTYCGATIGRVANRIKDARFLLGGREYVLSANDNKNCNHGGKEGFDRKFFHADPCGNMLELTLVSPDGDMGFPGELKFAVRYAIGARRLDITYTALSDKDTLWAPTCHAYFCLDGAQKGNCLDDMLKIYADSYTPLAADMTPVGNILPVKGTPFDFTSFRAIGERINKKCEQLEIAGGYDHNFVLKGSHAATAYGSESGISIDVHTDMPALQPYTGNFLRGRSRFGELSPRAGFALEPQFFPDSANRKEFIAPVLRAGEKKTHYISYIFGSV